MCCVRVEMQVEMQVSTRNSYVRSSIAWQADRENKLLKRDKKCGKQRKGRSATYYLSHQVLVLHVLAIHDLNVSVADATAPSEK